MAIAGRHISSWYVEGDVGSLKRIDFIPFATAATSSYDMMLSAGQ
jgi:hypothetical protein